MLNALRNKTAGIVMKGFMLLLVLSFGAWGIGDVFRGGGTNEVARVGDTSIGVERFRDSFNRELQQAGSQIGRPLSVADARAIGLDRRVLNELMAEAALDQEARELGLGVSDAAVAEAITANPDFMGAGGRFDPVRFEQILRSNGLNEPYYVNLQRRLMARRQIIEGLAGGLAAPKTLIDAFTRHQSERRTISYVVMPGAPGADLAAPDEAALRAFYDERQGVFQAPERRSLNVLALTPAALAASETVTDEEIAARYEQDRARFVTPETRAVERIPFPSMEEARAASDKIKAGSTFEEIATARNIAAADLSLGTVTREAIIDKAIAGAAFALPQGQVSEPIAGQFATALVRVTGITPEVVRTLEEVRDEVRQTIATARASDKILALHDQIEDARAGGSTLAEAAAPLKLTVSTIENVDRQGRRPDGSDAAVPGGEALLAEAFQSDVGVENDPVQADGGAYVWYDVTKVDPVRPRTFDEAREDVTQRWRIEEARKRLDAKVEQALTEMRAGQLNLPDFAAREGREILVAEKLDRRGGALLGQAAAAQVFATQQAGFGSAPSQNDADRIVFQVTAIETPTQAPDDPAVEQNRERIAEILETDLASQYVLHLQKGFDATVNNRALATALGGEAEQ